MLAAELALAGTDVVVVERPGHRDLDGSRRRSARPHDRSARSARRRGAVRLRRPTASRRRLLLHPARHQRLPDAPQLRARALRHATPSASLRPGSTTSACRCSAAGKSSVSRRTTRVPTSSCPMARSCERHTSSGAMAASLVRKVAGIEFPGLDPSASWIIGEVEMREEPVIGTRREGGGIGPVNRAEGGGPYGVVLREEGVEHESDPTLDDLRGPRSPPRTAPTSVRTRADLPLHGHVAPGGVVPRRPCAPGRRRRARAPTTRWAGPQRRRAGCGEPRLEARAGGQGDVARRSARHLPRRAPSDRGACCSNTSAQVSSALSTPDDRHSALHETMAELLAMDEPRGAPPRC